MQPLANAFLPLERSSEPELYYPLQPFVCERCFLVQLDEFETPENIFTDYAYYSSYSRSWLESAKRFANKMIAELSLTNSSLVIELGSNDGYLLKEFAARGVRVLGIDPAVNCAEAARKVGIDTLVTFFGVEIANRLASEQKADLVVANNVLAHTPQLNDFVEGIRLILAPGGLATIEVPHLLRLMEGTQYDTIYHEHFSYFSLLTLRAICVSHELDIINVEELPTHGGSIRIWLMHKGAEEQKPSVDEVLRSEIDSGLSAIETYLQFAGRVEASKYQLWEFVTHRKREGKRVAAYGAAAKGNTLMNYCGFGRGDIAYIVDKNPYKQGRLAPGSHLPVLPVNHLAEDRPDCVLILPWNLAGEIVEDLSFTQGWRCELVLPIPEVRVVRACDFAS